jgi:hypothetical protein
VRVGLGGGGEEGRRAEVGAVDDAERRSLGGSTLGTGMAEDDEALGGPVEGPSIRLGQPV